jgi:hypothetical protein
MIAEMNLGHLDTSFDIKEIFYSAALGGFKLLEHIISNDIWNNMHIDWILVISLSIIALICSFIYKSKRARDTIKLENIQNTIKAFFKTSALAPIIAALLGATSGILTNVIVYVVIITLTVIILSILMLPGIFGYLSGSKYINSIMENPSCGVQLTAEEISKSKYVHQCTQITIDDQQLTAKIILANSSGYFLHLNKSFLYIEKTRVACVSAQYEKGNLYGQTDENTFKDSVIKSICGNKGS